MNKNIISLIVLGYERDRHITGLHLLAMNKPGQRVRKVYIAYSRREPYFSIAKENAEYISHIATTFFPEVDVETISFDVDSLEDITKLIAYVIETEKGNGEVWIDLTSTTKSVISLSTFFTLFGARIYWVVSPNADETQEEYIEEGKKTTRVKKRVTQSFITMKKSFFQSLDDLLSSLETAKTQEEKTKKKEEFFRRTIQEYVDVTMEQYKTRKATGLVEIPIRTVEKRRTLLKPIKLRNIHKKLLADLKDNSLTLKELQQINPDYSQMAIRYELTNLYSIGFLKSKKREYSLTEIGKGYAIGMETATASHSRSQI